MDLSTFPRPPKDTGIGVHGPPTQYVDSSGLCTDWDLWKPKLEALGIKWFKILDDGDGSSFNTIKKLIQELDIMPVVRFYRERPNPYTINQSREVQYMKKLASIGCVYWETNNEPDLTLEWDKDYIVDGQLPDDWLNTVVDNFILEANWARDAGGYLLFPAFGPGGTGGENPFQMIVDKGYGYLLDGHMCLAIHNYALCRPLEYPNDPVNVEGQPLTIGEWALAAPDKKAGDGPMWAWEMPHDQVNEHRENDKNPDASIMTDSTCFRAFEYFDALAIEACGHSIPIITTEGGYNVGQRAPYDARYQKQSPKENAEATVAMFKYDAPHYYFSNMPWLIAVKSMGGWQDNFEHQGPWFTWEFNADWFGCEGELPVVERMNEEEFPIRQDGPVPPNWGEDETEPPNGGPMNHFDEKDKAAFEHFQKTGQPLNLAVDYGIVITPPIMEEGEEYWLPIGAFHLNGEENNGNHHTLVALLDGNGTYLGNDGAIPEAIGWTWEGRHPDQRADPVELKKSPERGNIGMQWDQIVTVWGILGEPGSGTIGGMHVMHDDEEEGNTRGHHSFYCVFMLYEHSGGGTEPPIEPPEPGECEELEKQLAEANLTIAEMQALIDEYHANYPKTEL